MNDTRCEEFAQMAPEVALGLLSGDERARALAHLAGCPACRDQLDRLLRVADGLLLLAPPGEPGIGFESRVMDRLAAQGAFTTAPGEAEPRPGTATGTDVGRTPATERSRRRWLAPALVAAALVVVGAVSGVVGRASGRNSAYHGQVTAARQLAARTAVVWADNGKSTCHLVAFPAEGDQPARLVIHLYEPDDPVGSYQVLAEPTDGGAAVPLGNINVANGQGLLTVSVPPGTGPVHGIRVLDPAHGVKYRSSFLSV